MEIIENWELGVGSQSSYARLIPTLIPHGTYTSRLTLPYYRKGEGLGPNNGIKILVPSVHCSTMYNSQVMEVT